MNDVLLRTASLDSPLPDVLRISVYGRGVPAQQFTLIRHAGETDDAFRQRAIDEADLHVLRLGCVYGVMGVRTHTERVHAEPSPALLLEDNTANALELLRFLRGRPLATEEQACKVADLRRRRVPWELACSADW